MTGEELLALREALSAVRQLDDVGRLEVARALGVREGRGRTIGVLIGSRVLDAVAERHRARCCHAEAPR